MRTNLPVTQNEFLFPEGETLVTTTDLKGRIVYCNAAFVAASGFSRDELLGQPHNIIRHPDMPEEAFRDMWDTIAGGSPWSGFVKNRRKNGDYYWVKANVTPLLDSKGTVSGYMSVRTKPTRGDVDVVSHLYAEMSHEAKLGQIATRLHRGNVVPKQLVQRWMQRMRPTLYAKIALACGVAGVIGFLLGEYEAGGFSHIGWDEVLVGIMAVVIAGVTGGYYLKTQISRPINKLTNFANQISGGNLTFEHDVKQQDEIGMLAESITQLNANLMSIVRDARHGVMDVRAGTTTIAEGNQDLSTRTESAASSLQQTAASMEQITATVKQSSVKAGDAAESAQEARSIADQSSNAVAGLAETMQHINDASRRISEIIQVVDGIAFQTNILALNAAVEAARAGEHGRGFAVVANEVRTLSQRTSNAAKEVRTLIQSSVEQVEEGSRQTSSVKDAMDSVNRSINQVYHFIADISHGMKEQMLGVEQINQAISQMDALTQKNAALVEEIAASAITLNHKADDVAGAVAIFQLKGDEPNRSQNAVELRVKHRSRA